MAGNGSWKLSYFLIGVGLGAAVGVLFAPRSGRETRERLRQRAEEGKQFLTEKAEELRARAESYVEKGKESVGRQLDTLSAAIEAGKQAYSEEKKRA